MSTKELIDEVVLLPVEERVFMVDLLLRSLNQPDEEVDKAWAKEAKRRLTELRTGRVKAIAGEDVFEKIWEKFKK